MRNKVFFILLLISFCVTFWKFNVVNLISDKITDRVVDRVIYKITDGYVSPYGPSHESWLDYLKNKESK